MKPKQKTEDLSPLLNTQPLALDEEFSRDAQDSGGTLADHEQCSFQRSPLKWQEAIYSRHNTEEYEMVQSSVPAIDQSLCKLYY